jgi:hypothetical protein
VFLQEISKQSTLSAGFSPDAEPPYAAIHAIDFLDLYPPIGQGLVNSGSCSSPLALSVDGVGRGLREEEF